MAKFSVENPALVRTILAGLTSDCPRSRKGPSCPLMEARKLPYAEKMAWLKSLHEKQLTQIYAEHCRCLETEFSKGTVC